MSQERNIYLRHKISMSLGNFSSAKFIQTRKQPMFLIREQPMAAQTMTIQISSSENASLLLSLHKLPLWRENSP